MATRNGSARWNGDLASGSGQVTVADRVWTGNYPYASRFEDGAGTSPEELIPAAHAGCFSMALSHTPSVAAHTPRSIKTMARVRLRPVEGVPTIQQIDLETEGHVPGLDNDGLREFAEKAKATCAVSRALLGVERITVSATLSAPSGA